MIAVLQPALQNRFRIILGKNSLTQEQRDVFVRQIVGCSIHREPPSGASQFTIVVEQPVAKKEARMILDIINDMVSYQSYRFRIEVLDGTVNENVVYKQDIMSGTITNCDTYFNYDSSNALCHHLIMENVIVGHACVPKDDSSKSTNYDKAMKGVK